MSALTDVLHMLVAQVPFHNEELLNDAHKLVDKAEQELLTKLGLPTEVVDNPPTEN